MANLRFRATLIKLDEEEDVAEVRALVRDDAHRFITETISDVETLEVTRGGTEIEIALSSVQVTKLLGVCARMTGNHPDHKISHEIYNSLGRIHDGLGEED